MIAAIDPGLHGAFAVLDNDGRLVSVTDLPVVDGQVNAALFADLVLAQRLDVCVLELVSTRPGLSAQSVLKTGRGYGVLEGVLAALSVRTEATTATKWKKDMALNNDKAVSRRRAIERWPEHSHLFARVKDDGRAEAALLGEWWRGRK